MHLLLVLIMRMRSISISNIMRVVSACWLFVLARAETRTSTPPKLIGTFLGKSRLGITGIAITLIVMIVATPSLMLSCGLVLSIGELIGCLAVIVLVIACACLIYNTCCHGSYFYT